MAQIAVTILDPSDNRSAQLIDTQLLVRDVIPRIVAQLKLPERANYQLLRLGDESALPVEKSLAECGIPAGAELQLRPVRNQLLKAILDKLYDEAKGYVEDQAWELAKGKLEELFRLDPAYPDPLGLSKATAAGMVGLRSGARTDQFAQHSKPAPAQSTLKPPPMRSTAVGRTPLTTTAKAVPVASTSSAKSGAYQLSSATAKGSGLGCGSIVLILVGLVVAGTVALASAFFFLPNLFNSLAARAGITVPSTVVLGTGDVQVTLRWQGEADLDLHVTDPNGEEIWFASPRATSGGILDVDANGECEGIAQPVENVYWPTGEAPRGTYEVHVLYFQACDNTDPVNYEVTITEDGEVVDTIRAQMTVENEEHPVTNFDY
jgi:hypothetical protein